MKKSFRRFLALSLFSVSLCSGIQSTSHAEDTSRMLAANVLRMNDWLGASANSRQWRIYLDLNALDTQVGKGYRADTSQLNQIYQKFVQGAAGRHQNFQSVTDALAAHLAQLNAANQQFPAADFSTEDMSVWIAAFEKAATELKPMSSASLNEARTRTLQAAVALEQYLMERGPLPESETVQPLELLVQDSEAMPVSFEPTELVRLLQEEIALEWEGASQPTAITDLRRGLRSESEKLAIYSKQDPNPYVALALLLLEDYELKLNLGSRQNLPNILKAQVDRLIGDLEEWNPTGDRLKQVEAVRIIGLLEATQQAPALLAAFKRTFWQENATFRVSESLVNQFASQPVQNTQPVDEMIFDNRVLGTAHTSGQVEIDFVPNQSQAHFSLHLQGTVSSDNYSPVGPVTVYTGSQAQIEARRSVYLNTGGWFEKAPYGSANLGSYFKGTSCGRLIENIAQNQFELQRDGAQRIAARRAEQKMLNEFQRETTEALTNGRGQLAQNRSQANAIKPYRPTAYVLTSEKALDGFATRYGASQMAALNPSPQLTVPADVTFQLHDSMVNNYLEDELGGLTITDQDLDRLNAKSKSGVTGSISDADDGEVSEQDPAIDGDGGARQPFEITLDANRPVDLQFADQLIQVVVNIRRFRSQGQSIEDVQVKTQFKMHFENVGDAAGIRIEQLGNIEAALKDPDDITLDSATILNLIETTINEELARQRTNQSERGVWLPLNLIDRTRIPALQNLEGAAILDKARLVNADFSMGWASLAWRLVDGQSVQYSLNDQIDYASPQDVATYLPAVASQEEFQAMQAEALAEENNGN